MPRWLEDIAGPDYATAILWTAAALVLLAVVLGIVRVVRGMTFGTFVAGGRNRKTRLAVMDAAAVDSHRRLVLVRRDDVEHLILIGGPTDVVVEQNIRMGQVRRPTLAGEQRPGGPPQRPPLQRPQQSPQQAAAPHRGQPQPAPRPREAANTPPQAPRLVTPQPAPVIPLTPSRDNNYAARELKSSNPPRGADDDIDQALIDELSLSLEEQPSKGGAPASLDDEMNKLLGEISGQGKKRSP